MYLVSIYPKNRTILGFGAHISAWFTVLETLKQMLLFNKRRFIDHEFRTRDVSFLVWQCAYGRTDMWGDILSGKVCIQILFLAGQIYKLFYLKFQIYYIHNFLVFFAGVVKSSAFWTLLLLFQLKYLNFNLTQNTTQIFLPS